MSPPPTPCVPMLQGLATGRCTTRQWHLAKVSASESSWPSHSYAFDAATTSTSYAGLAVTTTSTSHASTTTWCGTRIRTSDQQYHLLQTTGTSYAASAATTGTSYAGCAATTGTSYAAGTSHAGCAATT